ncbi:DUF6367 family protein [Teredinibacter haidensis]|uniref:DUF6367 family protein n=1 Tax=Teredinibacter haidensis TaxID=2731755 RepID=UPI000948B906|nr:DUF6367 family protein [Teredinibacter haidensis]
MVKHMGFLEYLDAEEIDYLILEVPTDLFGDWVVLDESQWRDSRVKNWMYRVDPARPEQNQRRHVHIAQSKHINTKTQQASWNDNATQHDKHSFNAKIGSNKTVQVIARRALGLSDDVILERVTDLIECQSVTLIEENMQGIESNLWQVSPIQSE